MTIVARPHSRSVGAALGALVGGLVFASGLVLAPFTPTGVAIALRAFAGIGFFMAIAALLAGAVFTPTALRNRLAAFKAGILFVLSIIAGTALFGYILSLTAQGGPTLTPDGKAITPASVGLLTNLSSSPLPYLLGTGLIAGIIWVCLTRTVISGQRRRSLLAFMLTVLLMAVTILVESLIVAGPSQAVL